MVADGGFIVVDGDLIVVDGDLLVVDGGCFFADYTLPRVFLPPQTNDLIRLAGIAPAQAFARRHSQTHCRNSS